MELQRDSPPGPRGRFGLQALAYRRDPLAFLTGLARRYGDISHFRIGSQHFYLLNRPDYINDVLVTNYRKFTKGLKLQRAKYLIGEGLLTSEGELHRRQRSLIQPVFHRQRVAANAQLIVDCAEKFAAGWRDGETYDILSEMRRLVFAIIARTLFGSLVHDGDWDVIEELRLAVDGKNPLAGPSKWLSNFLRKLPGVKPMNSAQSRARLDAVTYRLINEGRQRTTDEGDVLSALLKARDASGGMSDTQLRDELTTLIEAGHITAANAITWSWYLLACHPEIEAKLHQELDAVLEKRAPSFQDVERLTYTQMVLWEVMRLYPPAWLLSRRPLEDFHMDEYTMPAGSLILMSPYVTQRDSRYFPEPSRFDPERWRPEIRQNRPPLSYFPFGAGPRRCIGEGMALLEGVLLLATFGRRWRLKLATKRLPKPLPLFTLKPSPVPIRLERRC